ncbi:L-seryl-tRNA(Sec) selenium transferase [Ammoniphilus oxalaticus]|uniref:L-seryl-tRNA(Sec) selenium transferase n=1 Tax=Ammoniphilus oxalaticus TaxID=66863 RepID=A0A419SHE5_9BACL|nr:L-seryl-tRNA(Sec) selenium transferase [Ammoniphilus oxalaticus]
MKRQLREIPAVHQFIHDEQLLAWIHEHQISERILTDVVKETVDSIRRQLLNQQLDTISYNIILDQIKLKLLKSQQANLKSLINGTGIILHTNLGRAVLAQEAIDQMIDVAKGYSNLEYQIDQGARGSRHDHVEDLICRLTGAEAAMVVNNNAAAVYLILREIAKGREVIVSRGQLVEIGGSFRVSEIMYESGAILREVGTTNKTHLRDYEQAIHEETALLLKVHTSNFTIRGFTQTVEVDELASLGAKHGIPVYEDLGSGVIYDLKKHGIGEEPVIHDSLHRGADIVSFSGDKLLGGPQVGVIAGQKAWIDRLKANQLARVLRVDKVTLAALEATLRLYLDPEQAAQKIPALRDMLISTEELRKRAEKIKQQLSHFDIHICETENEVGGGSMPDIMLPSIALEIHHERDPAHVVERKLRMGNPAVIGRITRDVCLLDVRTIQDEEIPLLVQALNENLR